MDRDCEDHLVALRVAAIIDGATTASYNLVLREIAGSRRLVMSIGLSEAQAIAVFMEGVRLPRPLTHDLMAKMLAQLGATVSRVIIESLHAGFFAATIVCEKDGAPLCFDARTSDAVALALRCQAPIFVREDVIAFVNGETDDKPSLDSPSPRTLDSLPTARLRKMLDEAIANEDYEKAQKIQDELKRRN